MSGAVFTPEQLVQLASLNLSLDEIRALAEYAAPTEPVFSCALFDPMSFHHARMFVYRDSLRNSLLFTLEK